MPQAEVEQHQLHQRDTSHLTRIGGWLFRQRTLIPVPLFLAIIFVRSGQAPESPALLATGVAVVALGEATRLWGVHHIGAISRTRTNRLGPLVDEGPFALVRNPLYLGNIALWVGFALIARLVWMAPIIIVLLGFEYHAIVRWEEDLLTSRLGDAYRDYMTRVPRWIPLLHHGGHGEHEARNLQTSKADNRRAGAEQRVGPCGRVGALEGCSWRATFFSERGTLIAIVVGYALLWIKARF
jgi:protein-S-isoprenylcysteine O-methyltransferase Ste14